MLLLKSYLLVSYCISNLSITQMPNFFYMQLRLNEGIWIDVPIIYVLQ